MARSKVVQLCVVLLLEACASTRQLSIVEAKSLSERRIAAATDEVYDATWLALEARGARVIDADRLAGTFIATQSAGATLDVDVAALGAEQRLVITPREPVPGLDWAALLDDVTDRVRATIRVWHALPEWKFDGRRNVLSVPGYSFQPPADWSWLDYDTSRRRVVVQEKRGRGAVNLTVLADLERRRTRPSLADVLQRAVKTMLASRLRLTFPDDVDADEDALGAHGTVRVLDGATAIDVVWHGVEVPLGDTQVTVLMACPLAQAAACEPLWAKMFDSQLMR